MSQTKLSDQLLALSTTELLRKFGSGGHAPGSGSAAAFMGLMSCSLVKTVATLTRNKETYRNAWPTMDFILAQIGERYQPALELAFQQDAEVFNEVIELRVARDRVTDESEKRRLREAARTKLQAATVLPLEICSDCIAVGKFAIATFDHGFQATRGDSGVAASSAIGGVFGALSIVHLNLREFRGSDWAMSCRQKADDFMNQAKDLHTDVTMRILNMQTDVPEPQQPELFRLDSDEGEL